MKKRNFFSGNCKANIGWYFSLLKCLNECFCFSVSSAFFFFFFPLVKNINPNSSHWCSQYIRYFPARWNFWSLKAGSAHSQLLGPPPALQAGGDFPRANICTQRAAATLRLSGEKAMRRGNSMAAFQGFLSLCIAISKLKEHKSPDLNSDSRVAKTTLLWLINCL